MRRVGVPHISADVVADCLHVLNRSSASPRPHQIAVRDAAGSVIIEPRQHLPTFLLRIMQGILAKLAERSAQIMRFMSQAGLSQFVAVEVTGCNGLGKSLSARLFGMQSATHRARQI